jgi:hypothetical protein
LTLWRGSTRIPRGYPQSTFTPDFDLKCIFDTLEG